MRSSSWFWVGIAGLGLWACGSDVAVFGDDGDGGMGGAVGTGGSSSTSSGTGGTTSTSTSSGTGGTAVSCPPTAPTHGSECDDIGVKCGYDDGPIISCRGWMECGTDGTWFVTDPNCQDWPPPAVNCPPQPPPPGPCPSQQNGAICLYPDDTQCGCTNCMGGPCGGPTQWVCVAPPGGGCPSAAPNIGQPCSPDGVECMYGSCSYGTQGGRNCEGGVWVHVDVMCPM
jgi:hypothetical protein